MNNDTGNAIRIFKGDDTDAFGLRVITVNITGDIDLTNSSAEFSLLDYRCEFTNAEVKTGSVKIKMSDSDTSKFPLGLAFGTFKVFDSSRKGLTLCNTVPFLITNKVDGLMNDEFQIDVRLAVDTEINIQFKVEARADSLWVIQDGIARIPDDELTAVEVPKLKVLSLVGVNEIGSKYTLADIKNLVNTILQSMKG